MSDAGVLWGRLGRWQEYQGEVRANRVRLLGIVAFYSVELASYHGVHLGPLGIEPTRDLRTHQALTALAVAWTTLVLGVQVSLWSRYFPRALPFVTTTLDLLLLTALLTVVDGPRSPAVAVYFLILALAALRFRLALVWWATAGSVFSYAAVLWFARYWSASPAQRLPRQAQILFAAALVLCGITQGQLIRLVGELAREFGRRRAEQAVSSDGPAGRGSTS